MSDFHAAIHAYDVMNAVVITCRVFDVDSAECAVAPCVDLICTVPGVGEDTGARWVREALISLVEVL